MDWALRADPDPDWAWVSINDAGEDVYEEYISSGFDAAQFLDMKIREAREKSKTSLESGSAGYLSAIIASISAEAWKKMEDKCKDSTTDDIGGGGDNKLVGDFFSSTAGLIYQFSSKSFFFIVVS